MLPQGNYLRLLSLWRQSSDWTLIFVLTILSSIRTVESCIEITKSMLTDEIERASSKRLDFVKIYATSKPEAPHRTWIAFFSEIYRGGSRVFDESGVAKIFKKKLPIGFRKRCNSRHNIKTCSRAPSCGNWGSTMHA